MQMKTMKMVKTVLTGLLIIISSIDGFGAEPAKEKPQTEQSAKNAPQTWMQIVLDDNFSNKGKVWKLAQDIYEDISG
ncbi:MAG: hypothetical protein NTV46_08690 [Verrucomicrobia bacterium]|nr:hypothetical protein [Verrucomicrobiota bacterium]